MNRQIPVFIREVHARAQGKVWLHAAQIASDNLSVFVCRDDKFPVFVQAACSRPPEGTHRIAFPYDLGKLIGKDLDKETQLTKPGTIRLKSDFVRPELTLIDLQKNTLSLQNLQLAAQNVPEISLFLQGGWGKPAAMDGE